jgi:hypothetical protein
MSDEQFQRTLRRVVGAAQRLATAPSSDEVVRRAHGRQRRLRASAVTAAATLVVAIAVAASSAVGGRVARIDSPPVDTPDPRPSVSGSANPSPTPAHPSVLPSAPTRAGPIGDVGARTGPQVPIMVRSGSQLLVPGGTALQIGPRGQSTSACGNVSYAVSPDQTWVAYMSPAGVDVVNVRTRAAYALGPGCHPIWGQGGLAYLIASVPDGYGRYASKLVVRKDPLGPPKDWAQGQLTPLAWVGQQLVFDRAKHPVAYESLQAMVIASEPGLEREVVPAEHFSGFIAGSPDGSKLMLHVDLPTTGPNDSIYLRPELRVVDSSTLRVLARLPHSYNQMTALGQGTWRGNQVIAGLGYTDAGSVHLPPILYSVTVAGSHLSLRQLKDFAPGAQPVFISIDQVLSIDAGSIAVLREQISGGQILTHCQTDNLRCKDVIHLQP